MAKNRITNRSGQAHATKAAAAAPPAVYVMQLYVVLSSARSARAISSIRKICDEYLDGRHDLEIVDISANPALAKSEQIFASPTLVKRLPLPVRRFVGDMSDSKRIVLGLDLGDVGEKTSLAKTA